MSIKHNIFNFFFQKNIFYTLIDNLILNKDVLIDHNKKFSNKDVIEILSSKIQLPLLCHVACIRNPESEGS